MHTELVPAKATLRSMLADIAPHIGLDRVAVDTLVAHAQVTHYRRGQTIFFGSELGDLVNFLVAGVVKLRCEGPGGRTATVQLVKPGQFFGLSTFVEPPRRRLFSASAHVPSLVAVMSREVLGRVLMRLSGTGALQLISYSWRALSRLLYEKCLLLTMALDERLTHELSVLAREFGRPHPSGTLIDVPLTHRELAELCCGSRANVSRALARLRRGGLVTTSDRRLVLTRRFKARVRLEGEAQAVSFGT